MRESIEHKESVLIDVEIKSGEDGLDERLEIRDEDGNSLVVTVVEEPQAPENCYFKLRMYASLMQQYTAYFSGQAVHCAISAGVMWGVLIAGLTTALSPLCEEEPNFVEKLDCALVDNFDIVFTSGVLGFARFFAVALLVAAYKAKKGELTQASLSERSVEVSPSCDALKGPAQALTNTGYAMAAGFKDSHGTAMSIITGILRVVTSFPTYTAGLLTHSAIAAVLCRMAVELSIKGFSQEAFEEMNPSPTAYFPTVTFVFFLMALKNAYDKMNAESLTQNTLQARSVEASPSCAGIQPLVYAVCAYPLGIYDSHNTALRVVGHVLNTLVGTPLRGARAAVGYCASFFQRSPAAQASEIATDQSVELPVQSSNQSASARV